jgi:hypothetical protein
MTKIEGSHIRQWMSEHESLQLDASYSAEFEQYLNSQPWAPSRLDWRSIGHIEFVMNNSWESKVVEFSDRTPLGRHSHLMLMYSGAEPSLLGFKEDALRDIDLIYSASPGARYFCGVDIVDGQPIPRYEDFAEFDGDSKITFRLQAK